MRIELRGGPLDGVRRETRPVPFLYVHEARGCFRAPGRARFLYRAVGSRYVPDEGVTVAFYDYAELLWVACSGCGVFHRRFTPIFESRVVTCTLCGRDLPHRVGCQTDADARAERQARRSAKRRASGDREA